MLIAISLGSLSGVTVLHFFSVWPPTLASWSSLLSMTLVSLFILWKTENVFYKKVAMFFIAFSLGWGWAYYQVSQKLLDKPILKMGTPLLLSGKVSGIVRSHKNGCQFDLQPVSNSRWKVRLSMQNNRTSFPVLYDGDLISVIAILSIPWGNANPGGMDFQKQAFIDNIAAMGKVKKITEYSSIKEGSLARWRQQLSEKIAKKIGNKPLMGVIQAMTIGVRHTITPEEWEVFQATGTSHVVAISGLHIGLIAALFSKLTGFFVRRRYYLTNSAPVSVYEAFAAMLCAFLYSAAAGFSIPTQRAWIMIMVAMLAQIFRKRILSWQTLAIAWLVVGIYDPFSPLQMGFWLSFSCVAVLIIGRSHYIQPQRWRRWFMPQWIVFIGLIPLSALFFGQTSMTSLIANFIFLPVVSFVIVPFSLLGTFVFSQGLLIAHETLSLFWPILRYLAQLEKNIVYLSSPSIIVMVLSILGGLVLLLPPGFPARQLGWFGLLPLLFPRVVPLSEGDFRLTVLDVGQGLGAVIETRDHIVVYDTGPTKMVIRSFLKTRKRGEKNKIVISHTDLDHRGGLEGVIALLKGEIITSEPHRLSQPAKLCQSGERWTWNGVDFHFIHPEGEFKKRNNLSCVLKVSSQGKSVLLTGDSEALAEKAMILQFAEDLKSDVLIVPHHGSLTSSSVEFVSAVLPRYAIFPVGKDNHYGFPREKIVKRYEEIGAKMFLTWQTGALIFEFKKGQPLAPPIYWRETFTHYWNQNKTDFSE